MLSSKNLYIKNYSFVDDEFTGENSKAFVTVLLADLENTLLLFSIRLLQIVYLQQQSQDCSCSSILRRLELPHFEDNTRFSTGHLSRLFNRLILILA